MSQIFFGTNGPVLSSQCKAPKKEEEENEYDGNN